MGKVYHHSSKALSIKFGDSDFITIGDERPVQLVTQLESDALVTGPLLRDEKGNILGLPERNGEQSAPTAPAQTEASEQMLKEKKDAAFQAKRESGNEMFRANDFFQAILQYTEALQIDETVSAVWSNRAMCFLKTGNHEKALADATKSVEVDPRNAKGWFRKGISLHAMGQYREAIPALLEAEKLEPTNKQVTDAIRMDQMKARSQGN